MPELPPETPPVKAALAPSLSAFLPHRSAGLKLLLVCALALVMIIPALLVHSIVYERSEGLNLAVHEVSTSVGGEQAVLGPVLALPYARTPDPEHPKRVVYGIAIAYGETGTVEANVAVTERSRGIHAIPVFDAKISFQAVFDPARGSPQRCPADMGGCAALCRRFGHTRHQGCDRGFGERACAHDGASTGRAVRRQLQPGS